MIRHAYHLSLSKEKKTLKSMCVCVFSYPINQKNEQTNKLIIILMMIDKLNEVEKKTRDRGDYFSFDNLSTFFLCGFLVIKFFLNSFFFLSSSSFSYCELGLVVEFLSFFLLLWINISVIMFAGWLLTNLQDFFFFFLENFVLL